MANKRKVPALKGTGPKPWTDAEEQFVRKNYKILTDKEMAATLNRGVGGVTWKRAQLGLTKEPTYKELQHATATSPVVAKKSWWKFWAK